MGFDLSDFDDEDLTGKGKAEDLTDGVYDFQVTSAQLKETAKCLILQLDLQVISGGKHAAFEIEHPIFIKDKDGLVRACRDLRTLGFDVDEWTKANGRPVSQELPKVPKVLKGVRFQALKKTNGNFHNINILRRLNNDGLPEKFGPEQLDAADPDDLGF